MSSVITPPGDERDWMRERPRAVLSEVESTRRRLVDDLERAGVCREDVVSASLVLGELLSNAIRHGRPDADGRVEVAWRLHAQGVEIRVSDSGAVQHLEARLPDDSAASGGRGLVMIDGFSTSWGLEPGETTAVSAQVPCRRTGDG